MLGWLLTNHFLRKNAKFETLFAMFSQAASKQNITLTRTTNASLWLQLARWSYDIPASLRPDFVLFWDKDTRLAFALERLGLRLYNSADAIAACDDKCETYLRCANALLPQPQTIISPKKFHADGLYDDDLPGTVAELFGYPCVFKEAFGSFGQQVRLVKNEADLLCALNDCGERPYLIQEYLPPARYHKGHDMPGDAYTSSRDLRVQVVGEQVIAAMLRTNTQDFRANLSNGGSASDYSKDLSDRQAELALKAARVLGLDFAGVDLLFGADGEVLLCEVNSNAHFKNLYDCCGVNAADAILKHIAASCK